MICNFCKNKFATIKILKTHQKNAKYCVDIQIKTNTIFNCGYCEKTYHKVEELSNHHLNCFNKIKKDQEEKIKIQEIQLQEKDKQLQEKDKQIADLQNKLENIAIKAVDFNYSYFDIEIEPENNIIQEDEYKLTPLEIENGLIIEHRKEDGYINVTNLCKAGKKQFKHWKELDKSKAYLQALSSSVGIPTSELIKYVSGSNDLRATWVHPQVAINIAQWISPYFDVKVSAWVYEIYLTGKVDISNTKTYQELREQNKNKELKITFLTNKYVKKQKRKDYENDNNVIYILTTDNLKKQKIYIFGKAEKLKNRLSTYDKTEDHQVVYYKECKDKETMSCVENMVFNKLNKYRQQANRERFVLPDNKEIKYFQDVIDECINFFKKEVL